MLPEVIDVYITSRNFKDAVSYDSIHSCPLALALKEAFPEKRTDVGGTIAFIGDDCYGFDHHFWEWEYVEEKMAEAKRGIILEPVKLKLTKIY